MILYHGTDSVEAKKNILRNGFKSSKRGVFGTGIYCTLDYKLALSYTDSGEGEDENLVIPIRVYNKNVSIYQYKTLSTRAGIDCDRNPYFYRAHDIMNAKMYCDKCGIKAILVLYEDTNEAVIYDPLVIEKIG